MKGSQQLLCILIPLEMLRREKTKANKTKQTHKLPATKGSVKSFLKMPKSEIVGRSKKKSGSDAFRLLP